MYCLTNFCCVCLKKDQHLLNLNTLDEDKIPIINKMIFVAFGHERLDVNISKLICNNCLVELNIAYKFKTKCLMSNEIILGYNNQLKYFSGSNNDFGDLKINLQQNSVVNKPKKEILKLAKCEFCPVRFKNNIAKKHHQFRAHGDKIFCKFCCKRFTKILNLRLHIINFHFIHSQLFCKICSQTYRNKESFKKHLKKIHNIDIFFCNTCNIKFVMRDVYINHKAWHKKRNSIIKTEAKTVENQRITTQIDKTTEIGEKTTDIVEKTTDIVEKPNDIVEKPVETKEKLKIVTRYLVCSHCDKIFVTQNQLNEHLKSHLVPTEVVTFQQEKNETEMFFRIENVTTLQENGNNNDETTECEENNWQQCETCQNLYEIECDCQMTENYVNTNDIDPLNIDVTENNIRILSCNLCDEKFKFEFGLRQHLKKCHEIK